MFLLSRKAEPQASELQETPQNRAMEIQQPFLMLIKMGNTLQSNPKLDCCFQVSNRGLEAVEELGNLTSLNLRNLFSVTAPLRISALTSLGSLSLHSCTGLEDLAWLQR